MKRALKLTASLLVTLLFTWWAFRDTDWDAQLASIKGANYIWILPYLLVLTLVHLCRTLRWGALLSGIEPVPFRKVNEAAGIGFMMLIVLPFRLGEFARPFLIAQRSSIRRSAAMTSVVLERIVDGLVIAIMLRVLLFFVPAQAPAVRYVKMGSTLMFAIFAGGLAFLLFALWHQERTVRFLRSTLGRIAPSMAEKVSGIVDTFVGAMRQLPNRRQVAAFFAYTVAYWGLNAWGIAMLSRAFDCSGSAYPGCQPLGLTVFQAAVVLGVMVVGSMIPSAPGMVGTFQAAVKVGLGLFLPATVVNGTGLAFANVLWFLSTGQQILFGLVLLTLSQFSFREIAGELREEEQASSA